MENTFITYEKALSIIADHKDQFATVSKKLEECIGDILAEDIPADRDFPPFDRVTMDGIAIAFSAFEQGQRTFSIAATAAAGSPQQRLKDPSNCIEIMTGAIMPLGADTVIRYEDVSIKDQTATINTNTVKHGQNIHFKGMDGGQGTILVHKGKQISSAEVNIAAAVGKHTLKVVQLPKAVIFSTGDELVPIHQTPQLHQIRRSNVYGIQATLKEWGITSYLAHLKDDKEAMFHTIADSLDKYDLFIFTGGVSKGKFDHLPQVLKELHITQHFHKVQQRPGKPFWFGSTATGKKVFALPGNPVSSFVCTYIYLRFWLLRSLDLGPETLYAQLKEDVEFTPDLTYFPEARLARMPNGCLTAEVVKGNGSGDFTNLLKTDGLLVLPQGKSLFRAGEAYPFIPYRTIW